MSVTGRVRSDRRCGAEFPLDDGEPSECDGGSEVNFTYLLIYNIYNIYNIYTLEPLLLQLGLLRAGRGPLRVRGVRGLQDRRGQGAGLGGAVAPGQEVGGYTGYNIYTRVYYLLCAGAGRSTRSPTTRARPSATRTARTSAAASGATAGATGSTAAARSASTTETTNKLVYLFIYCKYILFIYHTYLLHSFLSSWTDFTDVSLKVSFLSCFVFALWAWKLLSFMDRFHVH